jgi:hypothetical protein
MNRGKNPRRLIFMALTLSGCSMCWGTPLEHMNCNAAIAGLVSWPSDACQAMSMCANEENLSPAQDAQLLAAMKTKGCAPP